jgi:L-ascorbate metabolism protein UlaG (beta-lactamase superfamily)
MHIQHLGLSCFKFTTKDATVVTDPFGKESGLTPPRGNADIVILAAEDNELYSSFGSLSGSPFLVSSPGEYDVKGVTITGIPLKQSDGFVSVFLIESEGIKVLNLTHIKEFSIKEDELEDLGEIDVLIIPVGGEDVLGASEAAKIVNQIEAKIVIPSHYATDGVKIKLGSVDRFVKEMGGKVETMDKIILKKKELASTEETKVIILTN